MKNILRRLINIVGYEITKMGNTHDSLDFHLESVFAKCEIDCVIDVGANAGQYGKFLRDTGYSGWIESFEPVRLVFDELTKTAKGDGRWHCYNLALGDVAGKNTINVYSSSMFSSFLDASEYARNIWKSLEDVVPEEVIIVRLDDVFSEILHRTGAHNYYLKLDTHGYDLNVFRGASNTLDMVSAMQTELSLIHVYEGMQAPYEILKELHSKNYFISGMYPIHRDESLAVIEYDCVLIKKPLQVDG